MAMSMDDVRLSCFCLAAILPKQCGIYADRGPFGGWYVVVCHPLGRQEKYENLMEVIALLPGVDTYAP